ncbi:DUF5790 family protein [Halobaculum sp. MBLA0147]|uniref:DUF5790 family protein n=1 Tax=Halobaculum sp. MBLA0147 TaxID=3079934 RepID=UPI0035233488
MGQTTFDDDELLGEAASETREDVRAHLEEATAALPTADAIWETDADNVLGALNGLRSALDTEDAAASLRQARKQYLLGEQAGAFDEDDELGEELDEAAELLATLEEAREQVGELTSTVPQLRSQLEDAASAGAEADAADESDGNEAEA